MSSYSTWSLHIYYRLQNERREIGPTARRMKENNKNEESGDSGTLRMLAQPPDIPTSTVVE